MGRTHALSGAVAMLGFAPLAGAVLPGIAPHGPAALAASVVVAAGAALLPDLDHPSATIAQSLRPVSRTVAKFVAWVSGGCIDGTITIPPGMTRRDAFSEVYRQACDAWHETHGPGPDPVVVFWTLEPNDLTREPR